MDSVLDGAGENSDVHLNISGKRDSSDTSTPSFISTGLTTTESCSTDYTTADSATKLAPRRRTITGSITADSQHCDVDVKQHGEVLPSSTSSFPSASSSSVPPLCSQNTGHVTRMPVTSSSLFTSDVYRRSVMAEMCPSLASGPLQGPGSAVARLFGSTSVQPGARVPAAIVGGSSLRSGGRRSLHHSWVIPGRTVFSEAEAASKTMTSAVTSRASSSAAAVATSDVTQASNHF